MVNKAINNLKTVLQSLVIKVKMLIETYFIYKRKELRQIEKTV
jgi:hypothetical protein